MADNSDDGVVIPVSASVNEPSFTRAQKFLIALGTEAVKQQAKQDKEDQKAADKQTLLMKKNMQDKKMTVKQYVTFLKESAKEIEQINTEIQTKTAETKQEIVDLHKSSRSMAQIGQMVSMAGTAITGSLIAMGTAYAMRADKGTEAADRFKNSLAAIDAAQNSMGRNMVTVINPAMDFFARKITDISLFFNENPELLKAIGWIGAGMVTLGGLMSVVSAVQKVVVTMKEISLAISAAQAAASVAQITANATGGVVAGAAGAGAGGGIMAWVATGGLAGFMAVALPVILTILGITAIVAAVVLAIKQSKSGTTNSNGIDPTGGWDVQVPQSPLHRSYNPYKNSNSGDIFDRHPEGVPNVATAGNEVTAQEGKLLMERLQAEEAANAKRLAATKQFEDTRAGIELDKQRLTEQYLIAEASALQAYNSQMLASQQAFQLASKRASEDHQRTLKRIQSDSDTRLADLALNRDALGMALEKRATEKAKKDENDNYNETKKRRDQDYKQQLSDMVTQFALQRAQRLQEYNYNMALKSQEVQIAYEAYQRIVDGAAAMMSALDKILPAPLTPPTPPKPWTPASSSTSTSISDYSIASGQSGTSSGTTSTSNTSVSISGGGLTVSQTQAIAKSTAEQVTIKLLKTALVT